MDLHIDGHLLKIVKQECFLNWKAFNLSISQSVSNSFDQFFLSNTGRVNSEEIIRNRQFCVLFSFVSDMTKIGNTLDYLTEILQMNHWDFICAFPINL